MIPEQCAAVLSYGSRFDEPEPDERCPEDALPGSEFCLDHEEDYP